MQDTEYNVINMDNIFLSDLIKTFLGEENVTLYNVIKSFIDNGFDIPKTLSEVDLSSILPIILSITSNLEQPKATVDTVLCKSYDNVTEIKTRLNKRFIINCN